jgi:hypothetical protein
MFRPRSPVDRTRYDFASAAGAGEVRQGDQLIHALFGRRRSGSKIFQAENLNLSAPPRGWIVREPGRRDTAVVY